MNAAIVIPARWASTRFPGKPLAPIRGKSLIQRVWERVSATRGAGLIVVATDDDRIESHVTGFGGRVVRTSSSAATGTDRIAAALPSIETAEGKRFEIVINVQGDEPLIDPASVDRMIETLRADDADVVTMYSALRDEEEFLRRDVVKVVGSGDGYALYFSRAPVPHGGTAIARRHIGVYGYRRHALAAFASLPQSSLELAESLEQLRLLENGFRIRLLESSAPHLGVDRPEDIQRIEDELDRLQLP
jgi:3-deoxy-D-manno-octulosonate cytidylyltransferase